METEEKLKRLGCEARDMANKMGLEIPEGGHILIELFSTGTVRVSLKGPTVGVVCSPKE